MSERFENISNLLLELNSLTFSESNKRMLDEKFRLEFNYNSNHIEGNTITYLDTKILLLKDLVIHPYTFRELEEMKAHDVAFTLISDWANDQNRDLTLMDIRHLNKIILVKDYWKDAQTQDGQPARKNIRVGDYKETPNSVRLQNGEVFHYTDPIDVPFKMEELLKWYHTDSANLHPIIVASLFHHRFVLIHPFDDGNGRIARLLTNFILIRNGYPPVVIKSSEKKKYLNALRLADVGSFDTLIDFMTQQVMMSLEISIKAAKGENIDDSDDENTH